MSEAERDRLRERVASGAASGEERDRLAGMLARAIREREDHELEAIDELIDELRTLADAGSDRSSCTDALAGALLDAQIRAFQRRDAADAWRRLEEIRARLLHGGTPDLLQDRLAAALFNTHRGGELLANEAMRLAALEELRTRAYLDPSAAACRVALAELLADAVGVALRRAELERAEQCFAELERLQQRDGGLAVTRELGRALRELASGGARELDEMLRRVGALIERHELGLGDPLQLRFAELLTLTHADALRREHTAEAERAREQLRELARRSAELHPRRGAPLMRELGKALHDAAVLSSDAGAATGLRSQALAELRSLIEQHPDDTELRGQLMSALFQIHREAIEHEDAGVAEQLQAEADALLRADEEHEGLGDTAERPPPGLLRSPSRRADRTEQVRFELRLDYLRMLLATHALAGDRHDWARAESLLARARQLVERAGAPIEMVEVFGQLLVNAHVDAGAQPEEALGEQPMRARALLGELRELARANPRSATLQLHCATALFNAHVEAGRRDSTAHAERLLEELNRLQRSHPSLLELRRRLAMALVNHHGECLDRGNFARASELLEQLRELVRAPDADNHLRVQLAMALGNTLARIDDPACEEDDKRIVSELRVLASREDASETLRALVLDELSDRFAPRQ